MAKIIDIKELKQLDESTTYLLLISPETIPHLAIVKDNKYYSLTHKKAVKGEDFEPYFNFLKRSKRKMILIELYDTINAPVAAFEGYLKATDKITCLSPVKDCVLPSSKAGFVYELIPELYAENKIKNVFHVNLENDLTEFREFYLSEYSKEAIFSYIQSLNEKYVKRT